MNNDLINELNNKIDAQDKIINTQALEIARLKENIQFCLKSIEQEMKLSIDSRTRMEMTSCYQILTKSLGDKENDNK